MPVEATFEAFPLARLETDSAIGRIPDHQVEAVSRWALSEAVADRDEDGHDAARVAVDIQQHGVERDLRQPCPKWIDLIAEKARRYVLEQHARIATMQLVEHAPGDWRKEGAAATGRVEDTAASPVDAVLSRSGDEPSGQSRRRVVDAQRSSVLARQQATIDKPDLVRRYIGIESSRFVPKLDSQGADPVRQPRKTKRLEAIPQRNRFAISCSEAAPPGSDQSVDKCPGCGKAVGLCDARGERPNQSSAVLE